MGENIRKTILGRITNQGRVILTANDLEKYRFSHDGQ